MNQQRFRGQWPKIGIRPIIDARQGGIRESLEEKTMNLARSVATLLSSTLKNGDGSPVECVIADGTIGRVAEAAACAAKFEREGVGSSISVTSCWCYGSETMDMAPYPKAVWGFNGTERPGAVYLAAVLAAHAQKGLPAFGIYGRDVQDLPDNSIPGDVADKLLRFARAAQAVAVMRGRSYLSIGNVSMGIAGSIVDANFFQTYLGMRCEQVESIELLRRMEQGIFDEEEFKKAMQWVTTYCKPREGTDFNRPPKQKSRADKDNDWEFVVKTTLIIRDLMQGNAKLLEKGFKEEALGHNAIAGGFQGQRQWTDFMPNADFTEALLNTSFDWNGLREAYVFATENDACNGVAMLFGHLLTNTGQMFSDVRTYWSPEAVQRVTGKTLTGRAAGGMIHLINSGATTLDATGRQSIDGHPAMKPFWEITDAEMKACLEATTWYPADRDYFRGGGYSSGFLTLGDMPVTMSRLNLVKGLGPVLQIAEGWTADVEADIHQILNLRTDKTWPTTWFVPRLCEGKAAFKDVYSVMNHWGANHGAISYGHIGGDLITLASMLRIPVCMHNVDENSLFRPAAWNAFGMDKEGADYRACATYGALYH
ncbi:MAG: L-fucose isomerase [Prevotellaceae bacterium]|jgi:L-fucose isomerase|nr:L-fucose isomerase [Prevotellaceae bacterium]